LKFPKLWGWKTMSPNIPSISSDLRRSSVLDTENSVSTRRALATQSFVKETDYADLENAQYFPTLDAITRRILKSMYDALERAANEAEERARAEREQEIQEDVSRQEEQIIGSEPTEEEKAIAEQDAQLVGPSQTPDQPQETEQAPPPAAPTLGTVQSRPEQQIVVAGTAQQEAPEAPPVRAETKPAPPPVGSGDNVPATSTSTSGTGKPDGVVLLAKVTQGLSKVTSAEASKLHDFEVTKPAPQPPVASKPS
jgi:hypothetical protein